MLCTRCRIRTAATDDGLCTFCSGTRPPLPDHLAPPAVGPGGWGVRDWPRSPAGLSRAVTVLLGTVIATDLAAIGTGLHLRGLWKGLIDDGDPAVDGSRGEWADRLHSVTEGVQLAVFLTTAVVFIIWFHRTRRNAEVFDPSVQRMGPGWSVGGWFVPVASLWFPYRVADGIWTGSAPVGPEGGRLAVSRAPLNLWWAGWVASTLFGQFAPRMLGNSEKPEQTAEGLARVAASDAFEIVAAVLALLFVRALTRMQVERAALRAPGAVAQPTTP